MLKTCSKCKFSLKADDNFYRDSRYKDEIRYRPQCKSCLNKQYKKDYTVKNQIEKICENCGKLFTVNKNYCSNSRFCNQYCFGAFKSSLDYTISVHKSIREWIDGFMLSDMHISPDGRFSYNLKYREFADFISSKLNFYRPKSKIRTSCNIIETCSLTHPDIKKERKRWYNGNTKILPEDCVVNKNSLMGLYLGDGSLHKIRGWASLCTLNFTWDENQILCDKIKQLGLNCRVMKANKKGQPYIYFSRPDAINLLDFLEKSPIECYNYKFKMPSKEIVNEYQRTSRKKRIEKKKQLNSSAK